MINSIVLNLLKSFPMSFINSNGEFIAHKVSNAYFNVSTCADEQEVKCKTLEWLSRHTFKTRPFKARNKNDDFHMFMLGGVNRFLGTSFDQLDMVTIYDCLGNQVNRELTIKFIELGYDIKILPESEENQ